MSKSSVLTTSILALGLLGVTLGASPAEAGVNGRQARQSERILENLKAGDLTWREAKRLGKQQLFIAKLEAKYRADGKLTYKERKNLDALQDRARLAIVKQSHDRQTR
ncbi:MAG: hypothetical protein AAF533_04610 [Acidobacteriota bacterium]